MCGAVRREGTEMEGYSEQTGNTAPRVLIVDDVISTGESLAALVELAKQAGGHIAGIATVLAEGDAAKRDDIIFLEELPLFEK